MSQSKNDVVQLYFLIFEPIVANRVCVIITFFWCAREKREKEREGDI